MVRAGGGGSLDAAGRRGPAPLGGPGGAGLSAGGGPDSPSARMRRTHGAGPHRGRQVFLDPSAASERLVPQGEDSPASTAASDTDLFEGGRDRVA